MISEKYIRAQDAGVLGQEYYSQTPFPHVVLPDFLEPEAFEKFREQCFQSWAAEQDSTQGRRFGLVSCPEIARFIYSKQFKGFLKDLTGRTWRRGPSSYPQLRVSSSRDDGMGPHTDDGLPINAAIFLHMTKRWMPGFGGELCLWKKMPEGLRQVESIEPRENTLVVMLFGPESFHTVNPYSSHEERVTFLSEWTANVP